MSDTVRILTGALPLVVVLSAASTALLSWALLRLYRRSVLRSMAQVSAPSKPPIIEPAPEVARGADLPLALEWLEASSTTRPPAGSELAWRESISSVRLATLVQAVAGVAYACVMVVPWMVTAGGGFSLGRLLWFVGCYVWPAVLTTTMVMAVNRKQRWTVVGAYGLGVACLAIRTLWRNPEVALWELAFFWGFANGPATVLYGVFANRHVRAAGPLVLTVMVAGLSGVVISMEFARTTEGFVAVLARVGDVLGLGALGVVFLLNLFGFALLAGLAWPVLRWIGRHYLAKGTSDQQLTLDAVWLLFAVLQSYTLVFESWFWIFTGPVAFGVYKAVGGMGRCWALRKAPAESPPPTLLLLRVFALGKHSQTLLDALSRRWLRTGTIVTIAGPDLATATAEPHELLAFLGGRLSRQFVKDGSDLEQRVAGMDRARDPDGRHRVTEFFCHADTWRMVMRRLAGDADVVLMDLRGFSPANQGCLYELQQLISSVPLGRIVFLVDPTTARGFLDQTFARLWNQIAVDSPNRSVTRAVARLFKLSDKASPDFLPVLRLLITTLKSGLENAPAQAPVS